MQCSAALLTLFAGSSAAQTILDVVVASTDHTTLEAAVLAAPAAIGEALADEASSLTLFAPDDNAFSNLVTAVGQEYIDALLSPSWSEHLTCLLTSHVLGSAVASTDITGPLTVTTLSGYNITVDNAGGTVTVNNITVTGADIAATNGVIHSISELPILPPCVSTNIVDVAVADDTFSTLVSLVQSAGLADTLSTTFPLTVFAPTNAAFDAVSAEILTYLGENVTALTEVLTYHVVSEIVLLSNTSMATAYTTLNTAEVTVSDSAVNDVAVIASDILASNGVVQVIDSVLIPPTLYLPSFETMAPAETPVEPGMTPAPTMVPAPTSGSSVLVSSTALALAFGVVTMFVL